MQPFDRVTLDIPAPDDAEHVQIELVDAGYENFFIPYNNGFVRPFHHLQGGKYPKYPAEEGGRTYGWGYHIHPNQMSCFTPIREKDVDEARFEIQFHAFNSIDALTVKLRPGLNDHMDHPESEQWQEQTFKKLAAQQTHLLSVNCDRFEANMAFAIDCAEDNEIHVQSTRVIPRIKASRNDKGWKAEFCAPFPYGVNSRTYKYNVIVDGKKTSEGKFEVQRPQWERSSNPIVAACSWVKNRLANKELESRYGSFPIPCYDSYSKRMYAGGCTLWGRPYHILSLVEIIAREENADKEWLESLVRYVVGNNFFGYFNPEKRTGYYEYCGIGNFIYGCCAVLLHVIDDKRLKDYLLRFIDGYMHSQKVYTKMKSFPKVCHSVTGDSSAYVTACGNEETMHAAVVEAYRQSSDPELLYEAVNERGMGFLEHAEHGGVITPERFRDVPDGRDKYGYYRSMHMPWYRSRDAIHYRAEGLIRLYETTADEKWIELACRRASNYLRYIGAVTGDEFIDVNFEYPCSVTSQYQGDPNPLVATGSTDGEYFQDIYTAASLLQYYPRDYYLREKVRKSLMLVASTIRTDTQDPETYGEAWIPHYAWEGDYKNKSAGSRMLSVGVAAGTLLKGEDAGMTFSDEASYTGPLSGRRKIFDGDGDHDGLKLSSIEGYWDMPTGNILSSKLEIANGGAAEFCIKSITVNDTTVAEEVTVPGGGSSVIDILDVNISGEQGHFVIDIPGGADSKICVYHQLQAQDVKLGAFTMDENLNGRFIRRNVVLNNPYAPIAEKSFHIPGQPESYYRQLPEDEGYETLNESSYIRTWEPFICVGEGTSVRRSVDESGDETLSFAGKKGETLTVYDSLWTDGDGKVINGSAFAGDELSFSRPVKKEIIECRKSGEDDPLHPEAILPVEIYASGEMICCNINNFCGAREFEMNIKTGSLLQISIPKRSENTILSFNGQPVFADNKPICSDAMGVKSAVLEDGMIKVVMERMGKIQVTIGSESATPGAPVGTTASHVDNTGISNSYIRLRWPDNLEPDIGHYNIYRGKSVDDKPEFIGWTPDPFYTDLTSNAEDGYYYSIQAVNKNSDESDLSLPVFIAPVRYRQTTTK